MCVGGDGTPLNTSYTEMFLTQGDNLWHMCPKWPADKFFGHAKLGTDILFNTWISMNSSFLEKFSQFWYTSLKSFVTQFSKSECC